MPLEILGPLVICGISLTVLAVYFSGISKLAKLADGAEAKTEFLLDYADARIKSSILTTDKSAGFMILDQKTTVGLVEAMGSGFLTRLLSVGDIAGLELTDGKLNVRYNDFTHKRRSYTVENPKDAATIHDALTALKR
ncbi:MAG: hypothetical protein JKY83_07240 [Rhizobiaceae bacterium]|nr:hypothetical protein [Rhizobiaceae bacterium]